MFGFAGGVHADRDDADAARVEFWEMLLETP
jgi:hypothetical protein